MNSNYHDSTQILNDDESLADATDRKNRTTSGSKERSTDRPALRRIFTEPMMIALFGALIIGKGINPAQRIKGAWRPRQWNSENTSTGKLLTMVIILALAPMMGITIIYIIINLTELVVEQLGLILGIGATISGGLDEDDEGNNLLGVIYRRVSDPSQVAEGIGLEVQKNKLKTTARDAGIKLVDELVEDRGKSGTNLCRDGIREVMRLAASGKISHVFVQDISRIGRNAPETIYFVHVLKKEWDVKIYTPDGPADISDVNDLIEMTLEALMSQISAQKRTQKAMDSRVEKFKSRQKWSVFKRLIPVGYEETERDDEWIRIDQAEVAYVEDMFRVLIETKSPEMTSDYLEETYQETLGISLSKNQVENRVQRPVYAGKPTVFSSSDKIEEHELVVEDTRLQIIDEETLKEAQEIMRTNGTLPDRDDGKDTVGVDDLVTMYGVEPLIDISPVVHVLCPSCGGKTRKNRRADVSEDYEGHYYQCKDCGKQRKFPKRQEWEDLQDWEED